MKKHRRLAAPGKQQPSAPTQDAALPVAIFKNSLRTWRAQWQAGKAADQAGATDQQSEPKTGP